MFIRRPFRRRGYSRDLLALIEDEARTMGFDADSDGERVGAARGHELYEIERLRPDPGIRPLSQRAAEPLLRQGSVTIRDAKVA